MPGVEFGDNEGRVAVSRAQSTRFQDGGSHNFSPLR